MTRLDKARKLDKQTKEKTVRIFQVLLLHVCPRAWHYLNEDEELNKEAQNRVQSVFRPNRCVKLTFSATGNASKESQAYWRKELV